MRRSLVTTIPREVKRSLIVSHKNAAAAEPGSSSLAAGPGELEKVPLMKKRPHSINRTPLNRPDPSPLSRTPWDRPGSRSLSRPPWDRPSPRPLSPTPLDRPDPFWLRDACSCELCVDPWSKQKRFQTSDIPLEIDYLPKENGSDGTLTVTWSNDIQGFGSNHVSTYTPDFLSLYRNPQAERLCNPPPRRKVIWDKAIITKSVKFVDFSDYMSQDSVGYDLLSQLQEYGIVFLRNVPESETAIEDIASRIGPLQNTFYGPTWDVKSVPKATNIAYTSEHLRLHMDLLYLNTSPKYQLLHCLKNTCEGGASLFCDAIQAANRLHGDNPKAYEELQHQKTTFVYDNAGEYYERSLRVISNSQTGVPHVKWSPPFQAPFYIKGGIFSRNGARAFRSFTAALKALAAHIEASENVFEYILKEGECVVFDNLRVLHGRRAFDDKSGERWLKGAYVQGQDMWSQYTKLHRALHGVKAPLSL